MAGTYEFNRLRRHLVINNVVLFFLLVLLAYSAWRFQVNFRTAGVPQAFMSSVIASVVLQLLLFYPIFKFAKNDADREIAASDTSLSVEQQKGLRSKRLVSDFTKAAIFIFFFTFIARAPAFSFILSTTLFSFFMMTITYLQCFNVAAKRAMAGCR
jgi:hypothetical protein